MINKEYFKYLIKQNKKYLILIYAIGIIIPVLTLNEFTTSGINNIVRFVGIFSLTYGLALSFITPIYLFSFLQKKKSNILYFSLPVKKESLYLTTCLFSYFATIVPVVIYQIIDQLIGAYMFSFPADKFILAIIITIVHMFAMNTIVTFVTLLTQNVIDSLICSIAYMVIPLFVFVALNTCATRVAESFMLGYGNYTQSLKIILSYISLIYSGLYQHLYLLSHLVSRIFILYWIVISVIFYFINYRLFLTRTVEQSETYTTSIFMYPLIITLSTLSMMLFVYDLEDLRMTILMFSIIFILYLIMYYFSKRKVYFTWKIPSLFIVLIVACVGFSNIYLDTKGFNTIYELPKSSDVERIVVSFDRYEDDTTNEKTSLTFNNQKIEDIKMKTYTKDNKNNFIKCVQEMIDKKLISEYSDPVDGTTYELSIYFTTKNRLDPNRLYTINYENMPAVIDILSKNKLI